MFWLMPLISGLGTWAATGDFKKGLMSGLLGAGIGGIAGALGGAGGAAKGVIDATSATSALDLVKGGADAAGAISGVGSTLNGINAVGQSAQALNPAVAGGAGGSGILQAGADFLARKPVTSGLMMSALTSAAMPPEVDTPEEKKGERFSDQRQTVDRNTIGFAGMPQPGPSTYTRNEPFTPDNPYRYGQFEGEKMFFDNPGLKRGDDGGLPPLPTPGGGSSGMGIDGIPRETLEALLRGRGRRQAFAGGGLMKGPGDGQSDNIKASGPGMDILLSDGEYVLPADVVAALGAGSTDAGARRLDSAMSKIRQMSYGSPKQARRAPRVSI